MRPAVRAQHGGPYPSCHGSLQPRDLLALAAGMVGALPRVVATMRIGQRRETGFADDGELQELNQQMLRATWEAGLPTAAGVADALAELRPMRRRPTRSIAVAGSPR